MIDGCNKNIQKVPSMCKGKNNKIHSYTHKQHRCWMIEVDKRSQLTLFSSSFMIFFFNSTSYHGNYIKKLQKRNCNALWLDLFLIRASDSISQLWNNELLLLVVEIIQTLAEATTTHWLNLNRCSDVRLHTTSNEVFHSLKKKEQKWGCNRSISMYEMGHFYQNQKILIGKFQRTEEDKEERNHFRSKICMGTAIDPLKIGSMTQFLFEK